jgi:hypothetical protein
MVAAISAYAVTFGQFNKYIIHGTKDSSLQIVLIEFTFWYSNANYYQENQHIFFRISSQMKKWNTKAFAFILFEVPFSFGTKSKNKLN